MLKFANEEKTAAVFNGVYFSLATPEDWNSIGDVPTREAVLAWIAAGNTPDPASPVANPRIAEIKAELIALDIKRIRPLAESDADYLANLNAQAVALRLELKAIQETQDVNS